MTAQAFKVFNCTRFSPEIWPSRLDEEWLQSHFHAPQVVQDPLAEAYHSQVTSKNRHFTIFLLGTKPKEVLTFHTYTSFLSIIFLIKKIKSLPVDASDLAITCSDPSVPLKEMGLFTTP